MIQEQSVSPETCKEFLHGFLSFRSGTPCGVPAGVVPGWLSKENQEWIYFDVAQSLHTSPVVLDRAMDKKQKFESQSLWTR